MNNLVSEDIFEFDTVVIVSERVEKGCLSNSSTSYNEDLFAIDIILYIVKFIFQW